MEAGKKAAIKIITTNHAKDKHGVQREQKEVCTSLG
jgi:hypothetical protein